MNYKDLTKAFSVIMAAAIITSIGTISTINTDTDNCNLNNNIMVSSSANVSLEDIEATLQIKK